jgi:hypothetical protein
MAATIDDVVLKSLQDPGFSEIEALVQQGSDRSHPR